MNHLSVSEQKEYYERLREKCLLLKDNQHKFGIDLIHHIYPLLRSYKIEIEGEENIPTDSNAIFLVNHSNSHDIFTAYEVLSALQRRGSVMVATDCLTPITTEIFNISNATLLDRRIDEERKNAILLMSKKILDGNDGVIFGESTWNLHPTLPMHNIRQGISKIASIAQVPIIPTIFEYIEEDDLKKSESSLYKKCIIRFGRPLTITYDDSFINQTNEARNQMIDLRRGIWSDYGIQRGQLSDIDPIEYVNHVYIKKFKALGFTYNSPQEQEYLLFLDGEPQENEYTINIDGDFVPGITEKETELKKILHI